MAAPLSESLFQFLHILAACILVGSTFFVGFVLMPTLRKAMGDKERMQFLRQMGFRARVVNWAAIIFLFVIGFYRIAGMAANDFLWTSGYGGLLKSKISLAFVFAGFAAIHDFVLGRRVARMDPADPQFQTLRTMTIIFAQVQFAALLIIVFLSVNLRLYSW